MSAPDAVAVVIPVRDMAWCVARAIQSALRQTHPPSEVIVVDDGSADDTSAVVERMTRSDPRVRGLRLPGSRGHLAALGEGLRASAAEWRVLLDADDELTADSIARRLEAAARWRAATGEWPQLVYGDLYRNSVASDALMRFKRFEGRAFGFLTRELSLCPTSAIMLGREASRRLLALATPSSYNTDDEIVLAVGREFPVVHAGAPVGIAHDHASPTRMSNDPRRRLTGLSELVRNHRAEILREHGRSRLLLWRLRILRAALEWQYEQAERRGQATARGGVAGWARRPLRLYGRVTRLAHRRLTAFLSPRFEQMYF